MNAKNNRIALVFALLSLVGLQALNSQSLAASRSGGTQAAVAEQQKPKPPRRKTRVARGIPKGVQACIDRLIEIASADPLPAYGGQAEQIINNGLLWNDPKSPCSIGADHALRMKVFEVVKAWRSKDAAAVRSLLQELKSAAPQS